MKRKVLFVITKSSWGGAQRYVFNLATALPKEDFDVAVALGGTGLPHAPAGELQRRLEGAGVRTLFVRSFARDIFLGKDIAAVRELAGIYKKEKPDVVHLNSSKAGGVGALAARLAGVRKIIFTSHGLAWDEDRSGPVKKLIALFSWCTFLLCHKVIVISQDNLARAKTLPFCAKKIQLIYNGLPPLQFESRERARVSLALKVGLVEGGDGEAFWLGTIAELTRNKGLPYLIRAAKLLLEQSHARRIFHLFIIGSGEEEVALRQQIKDAGLEHYVHLVGFVADAYRWDKAFDLFALTSVKEGLPTVLLEAGQAEVPVVATNIPGNTDIVEDQKTGLLVEPKNAKDIGEKIAALMDDFAKRGALATNLHQKVTSEFSIEKMVEETKKLY